MISRSLAIRLALSLAVGLVEPYIEVAWKCRVGFETSEACVWRKLAKRRAELYGRSILKE